MVSLTSSSSSTPKISFDFTKNNITTTLNVPVSSSYLRSKEEAVLTTKKPMEPYKTLNLNVNPIYVQELGDEKKALEDPEIGVFGAEKYFSGDMDSDQSSSVLSLTNLDAERFIINDLKQSEKTSTVAPSVRSESSWNSQSMLLKNKLVNSSNGTLQEKKPNNGQIRKMNNNKKKFLSNLGCKCACSDGISVDVVDDKSLVRRSSDLIKIQKHEELLVQRKSLELAHKKLTLLPPWESRTEEEDTASDTSSDLFEIDNVTGKPKTSLARQGSDSCYAPSEASIEWSIVTASAADYSVISECATSPFGRNRTSQVPPRIPTYTAKTSPHRRSTGSGRFLMSCKSHKSVMVAGDSDRRVSMDKTSPSYVTRRVQVMEITKRKSFETTRRISNSSPSPLLFTHY